jgi:transketolase
MALEDLAMMRVVPNSVVLYPSDAVATEKAVEIVASFKGIAYIRTSRPATEVIYDNEEVFAIGKCKVVKFSEKDSLVIVSGGVTLFEALEA